SPHRASTRLEHLPGPAVRRISHAPPSESRARMLRASRLDLRLPLSAIAERGSGGEVNQVAEVSRARTGFHGLARAFTGSHGLSLTLTNSHWLSLALKRISPAAV